MIHQLNVFGQDKVDVAIETLQAFEPKSGEGYYLAFSGGKDSVVIKALADMAGVKYDAHYRQTSVDPPELWKFIKEYHPDVEWSFPRDKDGKQITMWNLIPRQGIPPTRTVRYCCKFLKEDGGDGRLTITGVRWAESANRRANQGKVTIYGKGKDLDNDPNFGHTMRGGVVLLNDNAESRDTIEYCYRRKKTVVNPIIDWDDDDVWEFIHEYNIPYCSLYDEGFNRLGCVGCPMGTIKKRERDFERWPSYKQNYIRAFEKMLKAIKEKGLATTWDSAEDVFHWWLYGGKRSKEYDLKVKSGEIEEDLIDGLW